MLLDDVSEDDIQNDPRVVALHYILPICGALSMCGSAFMMASFLFVKDLREHPFWMVFYMSMSDFLFSIKFLIPERNHGVVVDGVCIAQSLLGQIFGIASISWVAAISINLIISIRFPFKKTDRLMSVYHFAIWGYAILTALLLFVNNQIGDSGDGTCWVKQNAANPYQLMFFVPLGIYFAISIQLL